MLAELLAELIAHFAYPTAWIGLFTLIILEIVLGIDNLVFIAILADKLPPSQRDRARIIGLSCALFMRLGLLATISWIVTLTEPLFAVADHYFSGRDLIMLGGGLFLLFKATMELHERLEGPHEREAGSRVYAGFFAVVTQIVVLDAVFSIDSVITAVGMVDNLPVMMLAVIVAVIVMMVASKPLSKFVNAHPTVIILCLGFLMMIGLSLVAEGFGVHIPKGYLYAAIGFSVLIEGFNQFARTKRRRDVETRPLRERTAEAVLRLLGGKTESAATDEITDLVSAEEAGDAFRPEEKDMIRGVLSLAERTVKSIMTPRMDVEGIHTEDGPVEMKERLITSPYSRLVVFDDDKNEPVGIVQKKDLLRQMLEDKPFDPLSIMTQPLIVPENKQVLGLLELFRNNADQSVFVVDEFGNFEGLVTLTDVLETIAGDMREEHEMGDRPSIQPQDDHVYLIDGRMDVQDLQQAIDIELPEGDYHTVAGLLLQVLQHMPEVGEEAEVGDWKLTVTAVDGNRIDQVRFEHLDPGEDDWQE